MRRLLTLCLVAAIAGCGSSAVEKSVASVGPPISGEHRVEVRDGKILLDGEPFFVRGVGYEAGCRPGRVPWKRPFEPGLLRHDFAQIRAAGFNTIRTWAPMTDSELALAAEAGLWVIQGIWTDWTKYWTDTSYVPVALEQVRTEVARASRHPNILFYLVMNEPSAELVLSAGEDAVIRSFAALRDAARSADPDALVSFSNCPLTDFLDTAPWDIVCSNNYPYAPEAIHHAMGYRGYTEWLVRRSYPKPYVTTEFGLSVSPEGPGKWGYGGNTPVEQAEGLASMYRDIAASGAAGACPFMWIDGWWKSPFGGDRNEFKHDPHPEEWFGFVDATPENDTGTLRPVVAALAAANAALEIRATAVPASMMTLTCSSLVLEGAAVEVRGEIRGAKVGEADTVLVCVRDYRALSDRTFQTRVDAAGRFSFRIGTLGAGPVLGVAAGAVAHPHPSELIFIRVKPNSEPEKLLTGMKKTVIPAFEHPSVKAAQEAFKEMYTGTAKLEIASDAGSVLFKYRPEPAGGWMFTAHRFAQPLDLTGVALASFTFSSSAPGGVLKVMLIDADGERWFSNAVSTFRGKRVIVFEPGEGMTRDPYDGAKSGNNRYDADRVAGVAVVLTGASALDARLSGLSAWR